MNIYKFIFNKFSHTRDMLNYGQTSRDCTCRSLNLCCAALPDVGIFLFCINKEKFERKCTRKGREKIKGKKVRKYIAETKHVNGGGNWTPYKFDRKLTKFKKKKINLCLEAERKHVIIGLCEFPHDNLFMSGWWVNYHHMSPLLINLTPLLINRFIILKTGCSICFFPLVNASESSNIWKIVK